MGKPRLERPALAIPIGKPVVWVQLLPLRLPSYQVHVSSGAIEEFVDPATVAPPADVRVRVRGTRGGRSRGSVCGGNAADARARNTEMGRGRGRSRGMDRGRGRSRGVDRDRDRGRGRGRKRAWEELKETDSEARILRD